MITSKKYCHEIREKYAKRTEENFELLPYSSLSSVTSTNTIKLHKKYKELVCNKNCDKISDISFSVTENFINLFKKPIIIFIFLLVLVFNINLSIMPWNNIEKILVFHNSHVPGMKDFLVWNNKCKIPNVDSYDPEIMNYFRRQSYDSCSTINPLTYVRFNSTTKQYTLYINDSLEANYGSMLDCCYQDIVRNEKDEYADIKIKLNKCLNFKKFVQIPNTTDNILVKCKSNKKDVYINGHPMIPEHFKIRKRLDAWKDYTKRSPSILMIGIDSISRANLIRAMPLTAQKLYDSKWFEMSGYNKIGDNTYPNLMAILTGFNLSTAYNICNQNIPHKLDNCPLIWKLFREHGYVTAYAEDEVSINTFNYLKQGFEVPPVDYYLRPFLIAAEKNLPIREKSGLTFCLGYQHSADYIFDYAIELGTRYKNYPFFGLFWTNTFSHHDISDCSSMDLKVVEYLEKLSTVGILNESVVIFLSDHGMRFGPERKFLSGHLEERLPFMFIWLPQWLKNKYPEFINGLSDNKNQLTNPYDIHMTLKHLLELSGRTSTNLPKATDCPKCQSLLKPVPHNRSCQDIAIEDHWCTCNSYERIDINSKINNQLALFVVQYINDHVLNYKNGSFSQFCGKINLYKIDRIYRANLYNNIKAFELYRLVIITAPGNGVFEATIRRKTNTGHLELSGGISRLNSYYSDSKCISDGNIKQYCHCAKQFAKIASV